MALTIDATVGGMNSNSFATLEEIENIILEVPQETAWWALGAKGVSNDKKLGIMIRATKDLSNRIIYEQFPTSANQALPFPRIGLLYRNHPYKFVPSDIIPVELKQAQAEMCRFLAAADRSVSDPKAEVQSKSLSGLSVSYFQSYWKHQIIPQPVYELISCWGQRVGNMPQRVVRI